MNISVSDMCDMDIGCPAGEYCRIKSGEERCCHSRVIAINAGSQGSSKRCSESCVLPPAPKKPMTEQPTTENTMTEEPTTEGTMTEEPTTEETMTEEPTTEETMTEEPTTEETMTEEPQEPQSKLQLPACLPSCLPVCPSVCRLSICLYVFLCACHYCSSVFFLDLACTSLMNAPANGNVERVVGEDGTVEYRYSCDYGFHLEGRHFTVVCIEGYPTGIPPVCVGEVPFLSLPVCLSVSLHAWLAAWLPGWLAISFPASISVSAIHDRVICMCNWFVCFL